MVRGADLHCVIVGAGHAGGRAAEALRSAGFSGRVTMIGNEAWPPYERPALSKELLVGKTEIDKLFVRPRSYYEEQRIDLRLGEWAETIDRSAACVVLSNGAKVAYDRLFLATGARPRPLPIPGVNGPGVFFVRNIDDSLNLRERLKPGARVLIIGAGFIGLEVAAAAKGLGCTVIVAELAMHPLGRVAPREIGLFFADLHRANGIELRTNTAVTEIAEADGGCIAYTGDGDRLKVDAVVIGVGAVPNTELAETAGLAVDDGIVTDEFGRTSDPAIYAAGDATRHFNPILGRHIRLETWQNAQNQAIAVAKVVAGGSEPYAEVPWFWTDQFDVNFQSAGAPLAWDQIVWRGQPEQRRCTIFYMHDAKVVGGACINNGRELRFVKKLIASGAPVRCEMLADPAVRLTELCA